MLQAMAVANLKPAEHFGLPRPRPCVHLAVTPRSQKLLGERVLTSLQ